MTRKDGEGRSCAPSLRTGTILFALVFGACAWFYNGYGWNQTARYDSIWAFVEPGPDRGTVRIDGFLTDPEQGLNTGDWARNPEHGPHYYSNKAPGTTLLGIPFYAALYGLERLAGVEPMAPRAVLVNAYLLNLWVTVLPVALSALFFFALVRRLGASPRRAFGLSLLLYLGTLLWPFSTMMWGHTTAAAFVVMAVACAVVGDRWMWAGALAGAAVLTDYGAAPVALGLVVLPLFLPGPGPGGTPPPDDHRPVDRTARRANALRVVAGGALPGLVFLLYHGLVFGSPFRLASAYSPAWMISQGDLLGLFGGIRSGALWGLTFSTARGIFFFMPVLLLALLALRNVRGHPGERYAWFAVANLAAVFLANLTFNGWHGGVSTGARYQIVALPFWISLLAFLPRARWVTGALAVVGVASVANMFAIAAVSPAAPDALRGSPLFFVWGKLLGVVRVDLGLAPPVAPGGSLSRGSLHIYPIVLMRDWAMTLQDPLIQRWATFNLGERLLGLRGSVSLLPLGAWIVGLTWLGFRSTDPSDTPSRVDAGPS